MALSPIGIVIIGALVVGALLFFVILVGAAYKQKWLAPLLLMLLLAGGGMAGILFLGFVGLKVAHRSQETMIAHNEWQEWQNGNPNSTTRELENFLPAIENNLEQKREDQQDQPKETTTNNEEGKEELEENAQQGANPPVDPVRPEWHSQEGGMTSSGEYYVILHSTPEVYIYEADADLSRKIKEASDEYLCDYMGNPHAGQLLNYSSVDLRNWLLGEVGTPDYKQNTYTEVREIKALQDLPSEGDLSNRHISSARLVFDKAFQKRAEEDWKTVVLKNRLAGIGLCVSTVVVLLVAFITILRVLRIAQGKTKYVVGTIGILGVTTFLGAVFIFVSRLPLVLS